MAAPFNQNTDSAYSPLPRNASAPDDTPDKPGNHATAALNA